MSQPNILLIVSDEERRTDWLDGVVDLPAHQRLAADSRSFSAYYTHASPCSPSRATLYTGSYLAEHGVVDNVSFPAHTALDPAIPTIGRRLAEAGYESAYVGKWHLNQDPHPDMVAHGYNGWLGNDWEYTGAAWSGRKFDPVIAGQATDWLAAHGRSAEPWFLTVALVNPHDVMWYPADQEDYRQANPEDAEILDAVIKFRLGDVDLERAPIDFPERFDRLPENFDDDLHSKPEIQRAWRYVRNREHFCGFMPQEDTRLWLRQLDYYAWLHEELDVSLRSILAQLDALDLYDDTIIIYTSDHGDACGSHGLRAKLPCVYEEVMGVPLMVKAPGAAPASSTDALATHVDLARTIVELGGGDAQGMSGVDLGPAIEDEADQVRDYVFFAQDSAQSPLLAQSRYAVRGFFDGTTKYARYYGVGGGIRRDGTLDEGGKVFGVDAAFDDQDHEWYQLPDDPHELTNLANDRALRTEVRELFGRLREIEAAELGPTN